MRLLKRGIQGIASLIAWLIKLPVSLLFPEASFRNDVYMRINSRRQEHLATLGLEISGTSVLEVGAGIGDHTSFFLDRNCRVTTSDARIKNTRILKKRYPDIETIVLDLDCPPDSFDRSFDVVYCYGLLYHLNNPSIALKFLSSHCKKMLLLCTRVSFENNGKIYSFKENRLLPTESVHGGACKLDRKWVFNELKRHFEYVYFPITQPNHSDFPTDWANSSDFRGILPRAVFIASRAPILNPVLKGEILLKQTKSP